jgi:mannose-6-phosphate isomerase-like protein (cupin superfamily)
MRLNGVARLARSSGVYRRALHTSNRLQLVMMSLRKSETTSEEALPDSEQVIYVLHGEGEALIGGRLHHLERGDGLIVPAGAQLNLRNTGVEDLRLLEFFAPPVFPEGWVQEAHEPPARSELGGQSPDH